MLIKIIEMDFLQLYDAIKEKHKKHRINELKWWNRIYEDELKAYIHTNVVHKFNDFGFIAGILRFQ